MEERPDSAFCRKCGAQLSPLVEALPPSVSDKLPPVPLAPDTIVEPPKVLMHSTAPLSGVLPPGAEPARAAGEAVHAPSAPPHAPGAAHAPAEAAHAEVAAPLPHGAIPVRKILELTRDRPWYVWAFAHAVRLGLAAVFVAGTLIGLGYGRKIYGKWLARVLSVPKDGWLIDFIVYSIACVASAGIGFLAYRLTTKTWARMP